MNNLTMLAALVGAAAVYFLVEWLFTRSALSSMTRVERAQAQIREDERKRDRRSPKQWAKDQLLEAGYRGDGAPVVLGLAFGYLLVAFILEMVGLGDVIALLVALPSVVGLAYAGRVVWWAKRRKAFAFQLKQLFDLLRGQLEAGYGTQRAMEMVVPNLPDPLRTEFQVALDSTRAGKDLITALEEVQVMFPSRGFDLFVAALEVDREQGGSLSTTLQRASMMLAREFQLAEQSNAELAQSKQTFVGVAGILGLIAGVSIFGGDEATKAAYFSPAGITALVVMGVVAGWGAWRIIKELSRAGGNF